MSIAIHVPDDALPQNVPRMTHLQRAFAPLAIERFFSREFIEFEQLDGIIIGFVLNLGAGVLLAVVFCPGVFLKQDSENERQ